MNVFKMKRTYTWVCIGLLVFATLAFASAAVKLFDTSGVPRGVKIADDGSQDVNIQDQTTRVLALRFSQIDDLTPVLAEVPTVGGYTITLEAGHSVVANEHLSIIYDEVGVVHGQHLMTADVLSVATNVITLDEPIPYAFPVNSILYTSLVNMNVDGSVVGGGTKIFQLTNAYSKAADLTQIVFHITDNADMDDSLFGALNALTRGVVLRKKYASGDHYENIFNVKSNGGMGEISGPSEKAYDDKAPSGVYGYTVKFNFSGQSNFGVAIRLEQGDSIQLLIQDDIDGLLTFTGMAEGHFTD